MVEFRLLSSYLLSMLAILRFQMLELISMLTQVGLSYPFRESII